MQNWERALAEFIAPFRAQRDVIAALVCGSYVTGSPSPRSDVDVVIVLSPTCTYRERGNRIVQGYLFEYFANPPRQFRNYFEHGHTEHHQNMATMLATGRPLFDDRGALRRLRVEARRWLARPPRRLTRAQVALERYAFWDSLDNLRDLYERRSPGFAHGYHHHVQDVYERYARYLRQPVLRPRQLHAYLSDARARRKYLHEPFPDRRFAALLLSALGARSRIAMLHAAEALTAHATRALGGFTLDGFRARAPLS